MHKGFWCLIIILALLILNLHFVNLAFAETTVVTVSVVAHECFDGIDNDGDTFTDYPLDPDCEDEYDNQEAENALPQCNDAIDNDLDSRIDFPADLGCDSLTDDSELGEVTQNNTIQTSSGGGQTVPVPKDKDADQTEVRFIGLSYPDSVVSLLSDGVEVARIQTDKVGNFSIQKGGFKEAFHNFVLVAIDKEGRRSASVPFSIFLNSKAVTEIKGIFMPPTLSLNYTSVKQGTKVLVRGMSGTNQNIFIDQNDIFDTNIITDNFGNYNYALDTSNLGKGSYVYIAKIKNLIGQFVKSIPAKLAISDKDVENKEELEICVPKADLNGDCKVDIVDFSIAAFWWDTKLDSKISVVEKKELNNDGRIDIIDFSLLAFYWTG